MARKSEVVAQKKDNENLRHWLRVVYVVILFLLIYYLSRPCGYTDPVTITINSGSNSNLFALALIVLVAIALILKSPPLAFAVIIVIIIVGILFYLAPFCPPKLGQFCTFPVAGVSCLRNKLNAGTGKLFLEIGQGTGRTIVITGMNCTQKKSINTSDVIATYGSGNNITVTSGSAAIISDPNDSTKPWLNISCTDANGNVPSDTNIGTKYTGWIYVRYIEMGTNLTRTTAGTFMRKYEA